jgi:hypothetical protein
MVIAERYVVCAKERTRTSDRTIKGKPVFFSFLVFLASTMIKQLLRLFALQMQKKAVYALYISPSLNPFLPSTKIRQSRAKHCYERTRKEKGFKREEEGKER